MDAQSPQKQDCPNAKYVTEQVARKSTATYTANILQQTNPPSVAPLPPIVNTNPTMNAKPQKREQINFKF